MKLIRCYIENFGGLHKYSLDFQPGLTVVQEPNGFGKTTLAEFIRAMFYGFPRGNKDIEKDLRKKYLPWQGGKYGGYLIFSHEGKEYRIDRSFGERPSGDRFSLTDNATHLKSTRFTENIGLELFGVDADAFTRSTYMPQTSDAVPTSTNSIRAKLGNLIEDTTDIANFDKAVKKLKEKRSSYKSYRGDAGRIYAAQSRISQLQKTIADTNLLKSDLAQTQSALSDWETQQQIKEHARRDIRQKITLSSEWKAKETVTKQYQGMQEKLRENEVQRKALSAKYPNGIPNSSELDTVSAAMDHIAALKQQLQPTQGDEEAETYVRANADRFAQHIPTHADFDQQQDHYRSYIATESALQNKDLSAAEQEQLQNLSAQFVQGVPSQKWFDDCRNTQQKLNQLRSEVIALQMPRQDAQQLQELQTFFAQGVPSEELLQQCQEKLDEADRLKQENSHMAAQPQEPTPEPTTKKKKSPLLIPLLLIGLLGIVGGVFLLISKSYALGGILMGIAILSTLGAIYIGLKQMISSEMSATQSRTSSLSQQNAERIQDNQLRIEELEQSVARFTAHFGVSPQLPLYQQVMEISTKRSLYQRLNAQNKTYRSLVQEKQTQINTLSANLHTQLSHYIQDTGNVDVALATLNSKAMQYRALRQKQQELHTTTDKLTQQLVQLQTSITAFLQPYCGTVSPEEFSTALTNLRADCDRFVRAKQQLTQRQQALAQRDTSLAQANQSIQNIRTKYALTVQLENRTDLQIIRDDARAYAALERTIQQQTAELSAFYRKHQESLETPMPESFENLEGLKTAEQQLSAELSKITNHILELRQHQSSLRASIDKLPELEDEIQRLTEQKSTDATHCNLLDQTVMFLEQAKHSLSNNYLSPIESSFAKYMQRLMGEHRETLQITPDLDVQLERYGEARPLGHFSAGQTDIVHLCMRLALADALFGKEQSFIILDDPFVNLDDEHTAQALDLLRDLSTDHQIIYLVCNSSRAFST